MPSPENIDTGICHDCLRPAEEWLEPNRGYRGKSSYYVPFQHCISCESLYTGSVRALGVERLTTTRVEVGGKFGMLSSAALIVDQQGATLLASSKILEKLPASFPHNTVALPVHINATYMQHQLLWTLLSSHGHTPDTLSVLYTCKLRGYRSTQLLVRTDIVTGLPNEKEVRFNFNTGDKVKLLVKMSLSASRRKGEGSGWRAQVLDESYIPQFIAHKFSFYGLDLTGCHAETPNKILINKKGNRFVLPVSTCLVSGSVTAPEKLANGFVHGIGGKRCFGMGMPIPVQSSSKVVSGQVSLL